MNLPRLPDAVPPSPPQNLQAEQAVLGSILLDPAVVSRVRELLRPEDFYSDAHRLIFETIAAMFEGGERIDLITVTDRLHGKRQLDSAGGAVYVTKLLDSVPTAANVEHYVRIVLEKSLLRRSTEVYASAEHRLRAGEDSDKVAADVRAAMEGIAARGARASGHAGGTDKSGLTPAADLRSEPVTFIVQDLLPQGMLAILSGRDKRGKTLLALEIIRAVRRGKPFLGRFSVRQGAVAGFFLDDPEGLTAERLDTLGLRDDPQVYVSTSRRANLTDPIAFLNDVERALANIRPVLVVLDALYLLVPPSRDAANDQARMGPLMTRLNALAEITGAAVLVITHDAKSGLDVAGSYVIRAAAKTILRLLLPQGADEDPDEGPITPLRVLRIESKLIAAASWSLELRGVGSWGFHGTQRAAREATVQAAVREFLACGNDGTAEEISGTLNRRRADVEQALLALEQAGEATCVPRRPDGRGRPRRVYRVSNFRPASNFRPGPPDGNSGANPRIQRGVSASEEFPSGQISPREGQWNGKSPGGSRTPPESPGIDGEIVNGGPQLPGPAAKDRAAAGAIGGTSQTVTVTTRPLPADDGRKAVVLRMGENLAWRKFEYKPGVSIMAGEENWRKFVTTAGDAEVETALRAFEAA